MSEKFASANLTAGQLNAIVKILGGEAGALRLLRGELAVSEPPKEAVLKFHEEVSVGQLTKRFVPNEFFTTRQGLYLWNDMQRVLKNAQVVEKAEAAKLRSFDLTKNAYDREIKAELPERHETELWQIAELTDAQKNGEDGPLLTNDYVNIFYVAGCAVLVRWDAGHREWDVFDWELDDVLWSAGRRVFSGN